MFLHCIFCFVSLNVSCNKGGEGRSMVKQRVKPERKGIPLYGLYRYVPPPKGRVFQSSLIISSVLILADFSYFGHK